MDVPAKGNILGRFVSARYILAVLGSIGMAIVYGLKVNLSVALVGMLNHTAIKMNEQKSDHGSHNVTVHAEVECEPPTSSGHAKEADGPFLWSSEIQGIILSCYFWGYFVSQIPGWESVFYVMGGLSCLWCVLWVWLVQDSPQQQPLISKEERELIVTSLGGKADDHEHKKLPVPWKAVLTSGPFLAILVAHACSNWGWYMLLIELPFYMKQVLKFNMSENAVATALPFLSLWFFSLALSKSLDWLRGKSYITTTTARKVGTLFASAVPAVCLLGLCYVGCNRGLAVALTALGVTAIGGMFCGFLSNHIDIAPNFAGTLMAMTNTVATIPGIVVPIFVGVLTHGNQTISAWRVIFFVTIGLYVIEIVVYTIFGSGEQQPWNNVPQHDGENHEEKPLKNETDKNDQVAV
ncbi:jg7902 [Pararge aegeria aegeria]|uniref:Jg7902 protein n=1 Tax=Pararge aegeria aegeria TaxID=348720 RepID=A0A8S4RBG0_9NEOP|nr:jg7902 [Pararge aegeria aegeria]